MERFCLDCQALLKGRADKKFCDDQCRSNYNNRLKTVNNQFLNAVNKILKKNRDVLEAQTPREKLKLNVKFCCARASILPTIPTPTPHKMAMFIYFATNMVICLWLTMNCCW